MATLGQFEAYLRQLDHGRALGLVQQAHRDGVALESIVTGLLAPALVEVGRQWAADEVEAAVALAAAAIVRSCLPRATLPAGTATLGGRSVAVCCPPGEEHEIPAEMVSELLRNRGWRALHLGAGATPEQMPNFLAAQRPGALLVSATTPWGLVGAARMVEVAQREGVPALVGGAAFGTDGSRARRIGAAGWARSVGDAVALLEAWSADPPVLTPHAPPSEYVRFEEWLPDIRRAALAAAGEGGGRHDPVAASATEDRVEMVLRHVGAALLVGDAGVLFDSLSLAGAYYEARHVGLGCLEDAVQAVARALPVEMVAARDVVAAGLAYLAGIDRSGAEETSRWSMPAPSIAGPSLPAPAIPAPANAAPAISEPDHAVFAAPPSRREGNDDEAGRVFTDLLFVAAKSCRAPLALISVAQADGRWSTLRHTPPGAAAGRRDKVGEELLFGLVAAHGDPTEITNLADHPRLATTAMAQAPNGLRFAYGVPLRATPQGPLLGVLCLLDHRTRALSARECQAVAAVARQVTGQLARWRTSGGAAKPGDAGAAPAIEARAGEGRRLRSHEVAVLFDVTDRTVINWAASNRLPSARTVGGHLRFRRDDVLALLAGRPIADQ